ncbi:MAG TPA: hypothetical protein PKZ70_08460 [Candidatus Atribacteria bacterium]|nr:hypothetical protein [Candidatus Atribacteria bacterium]
MKQFKEFYSDDNGAWLEVFCYQLMPCEVEELIDVLKGFTFLNIQEDSLLARISGTYNDVWYTMLKLKEKGFSWG